MSLTGKGSLSIRKKDVQEQKTIALGFKNMVFAHKATAGATGINLNALVAPSEMPTFVQPTVNDLVTARLMFFRKNLRLVSSLRGLLMDYLSYEVASNTQINFNGFTAEEGEIFMGHVDYKPITEKLVVDGRAISATGILAIAATDFNVGTPFEINKYSGAQVGAVMVFRNGVLQARNSGNSSVVLDGNYYEVDAGAGLGTIIRFNAAPVSQDDNIVVVSNGLLVERPTGSMMAEIETLAGQIDAMIPALAEASGSPESAFQVAPNNVDLKAFGDQVLEHESRIDSLEIAKGLVALKNTGNHTLNGNWQDVAGWVSTPISTDGSFNLTTGEFTFASSGLYLVTAKVGFSTNATGGRGVKLMLNNVDIPGSAQLIPATAANGVSPITTMLISASGGNTLKVAAYQSSGGNLAYEINADGQIQLSIVKMGN